MGCASSNEAAATDSGRQRQQHSQLIGTVPSNTAAPSSRLPDLPPAHTNAGMDMAFTVLHDPVVAVAPATNTTRGGRRAASRLATPHLGSESPAAALMLPTTRGSCNTALASTNAPFSLTRTVTTLPGGSSPGLSHAHANVCNPLIAGLHDDTASTGQPSSLSGSVADHPKPLSVTNVQAHTTVENAKLRALSKAGGPAVAGSPRTWEERMAMWVDELPPAPAPGTPSSPTPY